MVSINDLELMAQGAQAEVFHYGEDKVLRVLRNPEDSELLKKEIQVMKELKGRMDIPEVFESLSVENRPAVVVEKIKGPTMLDYIKAHPLKLKEQAVLLAKLHANMPDAIDINSMGASKGRARFLTGLSHLSEDMKAFVFEIIDELPEGAALCHGDFHPGNIIKSGAKNYIIDWFGAYKGDLLSDAAHTYLLFKNVPKFPGVTGVQYKMIKVSGAMIAKTYLDTFYAIRPFDWTEFSKWLLVKAGERCFYGVEDEKPMLMKFIKTCKADASHPERWYKKL